MAALVSRLGATLLKREELVAQIDEGGSGALTPQFEIEQSTVESQSLFNVTDLKRYVVETNCASFSCCFSHGALQLAALILHCRQRFIEKREHGGMTSHVIETDERGTSAGWPQRAHRKVVRSPMIIGELKCCRHQCA
jgi:hypothetical protein